MKLRIIFALLVFALAGGATILQSRSLSRVEMAAMPSMQELQANVDKLPIDTFEDRSLENPRDP
jgi:hypothetical protein